MEYHDRFAAKLSANVRRDVVILTVIVALRPQVLLQTVTEAISHIRHTSAEPSIKEGLSDSTVWLLCG